jgi:hypothetical protein
MSHLVPKRIKGNVYWEEVHSERDGKRVQQVFDFYIGRAGNPKRNPSTKALENLGREKFKEALKREPGLEVYDAPDEWLKSGRLEWRRLKFIDRYNAATQAFIFRDQKGLKYWMKKYHRNPLEIQEVQDRLLIGQGQRAERHSKIAQRLRHTGRQESGRTAREEHDYLERREMDVRHAAIARNLSNGIKPVAAIDAASKESEPQRRALERFEAEVLTGQKSPSAQSVRLQIRRKRA